MGAKNALTPISTRTGNSAALHCQQVMRGLMLKLRRFKLSISGEPIVAMISWALFFILAIAWIIRRRIIRERQRSGLNANHRYTKTQIFGIAGIILFLMPIFLVIFSNLLRGLMISILIVFRALQLPEYIISVLASILVPFLYILMFVALYLFVEFVWPKRKVLEA